MIRKLCRGLIYFFLMGLLIFMLFPIVYAFFGSFKSVAEFLQGGVRIIPRAWRYQNYSEAFSKVNFGIYTFNSVVFSLASVVGILITTTMTGYILARKVFIGKKLMLASFGAALFLTGATTLFPVVIICKHLGLLNSLWGMIIVQIAWSQPMYSILAMGYCSGISKSLDESAMLDGCNSFLIYWKIIMPIMKPINATIALLSFREAWNAFMLPLAFTLTKPTLRTLAVGIVNLKDGGGEGVSAWNLMIAGTMISILPMIIVYLTMNRYFLSGLSEGAVKG